MNGGKIRRDNDANMHAMADKTGGEGEGKVGVTSKHPNSPVPTLRRRFAT